MFINYIKIQMIRYLKGRSIFTTVILASLMILLSVVLAFFMYALLKSAPSWGVTFSENDEFIYEISNEVQFSALFEGFLTYAETIFMGPLIIGVFACAFVCGYYKNRIYINLDISMRNRALYCLSEIVIILFMALIFYVLCYSSAVVILLISSGDFGKEPVTEVVAALCTSLCVCINQIFFAYFCAKLCRKTGYSIFMFLISELVLTVASVLINKSAWYYYPLHFIFADSPYNWYLSGENEPLFLTDEWMIPIAISIVRATCLFIISVFLFRRKYEEKVL